MGTKRRPAGVSLIGLTNVPSLALLSIFLKQCVRVFGWLGLAKTRMFVQAAYVYVVPRAQPQDSAAVSASRLYAHDQVRAESDT